MLRFSACAVAFLRGNISRFHESVAGFRSEPVPEWKDCTVPEDARSSAGHERAFRAGIFRDREMRQAPENCYICVRNISVQAYDTTTIRSFRPIRAGKRYARASAETGRPPNRSIFIGRFGFAGPSGRAGFGRRGSGAYPRPPDAARQRVCQPSAECADRVRYRIAFAGTALP